MSVPTARFVPDSLALGTATTSVIGWRFTGWSRFLASSGLPVLGWVAGCVPGNETIVFRLADVLVFAPCVDSNGRPR